MGRWSEEMVLRVVEAIFKVSMNLQNMLFAAKQPQEWRAALPDLFNMVNERLFVVFASSVDLIFDFVDLSLDSIDWGVEGVYNIIANFNLVAKNGKIIQRNSHKSIEYPVTIDREIVFQEFDPVENMIRMFTITEAEAKCAGAKHHHVDSVGLVFSIRDAIWPKGGEVVVGEILNLLLNFPVQNILYCQRMYSKSRTE